MKLNRNYVSPTKFSVVKLIGDFILLFCVDVGQRFSFSYDKVFDHGASQEDVFVEMSQLVQSALDGYKV